MASWLVFFFPSTDFSSFNPSKSHEALRGQNTTILARRLVIRMKDLYNPHLEPFLLMHTTADCHPHHPHHSSHYRRRRRQSPGACLIKILSSLLLSVRWWILSRPVVPQMLGLPLPNTVQPPGSMLTCIHPNAQRSLPSWTLEILTLRNSRSTQDKHIMNHPHRQMHGLQR
jgi:hypothetical protein